MMKGYLAISYKNRDRYEKVIGTLKAVFKKNNCELLVFVDAYSFGPDQDLEMMKEAFAEIDSCSFLIAELSTKAIGVGIEIGYAVAKRKPIIYIKNKQASYSTTAGGSASWIFEYEDELDLENQLGRWLLENQTNLLSKRN